MKVSKELIGKYHNGECTPEEIAMVENWLLDDESEDPVFMTENMDIEKVKAEIWADISNVLPSAKKQFKLGGLSFKKSTWTSVAAAASVILILSASFFIFRQHTSYPVITSVNTSLSDNKEIDSNDYTISLGPESNARIDENTGLIDFCGTILISPKKDIFLTFKDICTTSNRNTERMTFKKGETYIALNYKNKANNEVVVMEEKLLMGLPPAVKRQIMDQFNI